MVESGIGYRVSGIGVIDSDTIAVQSPENFPTDTRYPVPDTRARVFEILSTVMDPEIPTLSVIDLGMITGVTMSDDGVCVRLLPTFVACPATSYIRANITDALAKSGFANAKVEMETELSWSSDRVTEHGRKQLEEFGLGAPIQIDGVLNLDTIEHVNCPHCGSGNTTLRSMFGSTLCRSIHYCEDCKQGFERFKPL
jgi:ring-1,2-phenylacetyl-CoA epoxidase subunit PaaD